jgi:multicomponent Na+:H+ antiporter subunit G
MIPALLFLIASIFVLGTGIGLLRLRDPLSRLHASTKAATLGTAFALLAVILNFRDPGIIALSAITLALIFFTAPIAAHAIACRLWTKDKNE